MSSRLEKLEENQRQSKKKLERFMKTGLPYGFVNFPRLLQVKEF